MTFKALVAGKTGDTISSSPIDFKGEDLMPGDVTVAAEYSTVTRASSMDLPAGIASMTQRPHPWRPTPGLPFPTAPCDVGPPETH